MAIILFRLMITAIMGVMHPFYVGVTEIQHNAGDQTLEISIKLFIDDFEKGLSQANQTPVDLTQPKDSVLVNSQVFRYIQQHLQLSVNGKPVRLEYLGYEREREAAWCYVQVTGVPTVQKTDVSNTLLYNVLDQQIHLIHVTVKGKRKSGKIMYPEKNFTAIF